jgi:MFS-type transporter involved in bile tolerance (Atg22 family)
VTDAGRSSRDWWSSVIAWISLCLPVIALLLCATAGYLDRRLEARIPPGRDEDDFGGWPGARLFLIAFMLPVLGLIASIAACALRRRWTTIAAIVVNIGAIALVTTWVVQDIR